MKNTPKKIVLAIVLIVIAAFTAIFFTFRGFMLHRIDSKARTGLENSVSQYSASADDLFGNISDALFSDENTDDTLYSVNFIPCSDESREDSDFYFLFYEGELEEEIEGWFEDNDADDDEIVSFTVSEQTVYAVRVNEGQQKWIYYINVTQELHLLAETEAGILIVMAVCTLLASLAGYAVGRKIAKDEQKQKKFFENASHELKTPLMAIQGYTEGLKDGVVSDPERAYEVIMEETDKMASLVDEIMCLSRLESGVIRLQKAETDMGEMIGDCLMGIEYRASVQNIRIEADIKDIKINADRQQFERAVTNLLSNAVRYAKTRIVVSCSEKELSVWNDEDPLSDDELKNLFERFYMGKGGSTGIGLSLTKEIVEKHGFKIAVKNSDDGVAFIIHFGR